MHSDYYNIVFGEKLANILYEANSQFFYERNVIEEARQGDILKIS